MCNNFNNSTVKITAYSVLAYTYYVGSIMCFISKAMSTIETNYSCHIKL